MTYAEVFSGASPGWIFDPASWILPFPLYWSHVVFFLGLAVRYRRTSLAHLYLWGILFGLYETWVTKVVWAGFFDSPPLIGPILGFAIFEAVVIVLFWHPIFSFILPVLTFELMAYSSDNSALLLPGHVEWLIPRRRITRVFQVLVLIGGANLANGCGNDLLLSLLTGAGSVGLVYIVYRLATRGDKKFSIESVTVGRRGLLLSGGFIVFLYLTTLIAIRPESIPGPGTLLLTIQIYAIVAALLHASPTEPVELQSVGGVTLVELRWFWRTMVYFLLFTAVFSLLPVLDMVVVVGGLLIMFGLGPLVLLSALFRLWRRPDYRRGW